MTRYLRSGTPDPAERRRPLRRSDDSGLDLLLSLRPPPQPPAPQALGADIQLACYPVRPTDALTGPAELNSEAEGALYLIDSGVPDAALVMAAAVRHLPRGRGGQDLLRRAEAGAMAWRRERLHAARQLRRADQLIAFADRLSHAEEVEEVRRVLTDFAPRVVGGHRAVLFVQDQDDENVMRPADIPLLAADSLPLSIPVDPRFLRPGVLRSKDLDDGTGASFPGLMPLFAAAGVVTIAHQPFGDRGVLCLLERREGRDLEPEDWSVLATLVRLAQSAVERLQVLLEVQELSLADPLTGLGNRRRLAISLQTAVVAGRRGDPVTLVMMDLDSFKAVNDRSGHIAGDRVLRIFAATLREQARGSDLLVRYGGDEFVAVLAGDAAGAEVFLKRVRHGLRGRIRFTAGIAQCHPEVEGPDQLIEAADRDLYRRRAKRLRAS